MKEAPDFSLFSLGFSSLFALSGFLASSTKTDGYLGDKEDDSNSLLLRSSRRLDSGAEQRERKKR